MPKVTTYTRTRIELLDKQGLHPAGIFTSLKREGLSVSFSSVTRIIKKLHITGSVKNLPRSGRPQKLSMPSKCLKFSLEFSRDFSMKVHEDKERISRISLALLLHSTVVNNFQVNSIFKDIFFLCFLHKAFK